jgi:hypothetical protein
VRANFSADRVRALQFLAVFAGLLGFQQKPYFQATAGAETAPAVKFDFGAAPTPAK